MYTLFSSQSGVAIEAIIVDRSENRMRVIAPGFSDAIELVRTGDQWQMDCGEIIQFEFLTPTSPADRPAAVEQPASVSSGKGGHRTAAAVS